MTMVNSGLKGLREAIGKICDSRGGEAYSGGDGKSLSASQVIIKYMSGSSRGLDRDVFSTGNF